MLRFIILLLIVIASVPAWAQENEEARRQLDSTMDAIKASTERQERINAENAKLEQELGTLQEETVSLARKSSEQEEALSEDEERLGILEEQKKAKDKALSERQQELSSLISAMIKLRSLPPGAIIAMPGKLNETLEAARALSIVTHTIEEDSESLKEQLAEINELAQKIGKDRQAVITHKSQLVSQHEKLATKIKERSKLQQQLGVEGTQEKEHLATLQEKSHSLQELVEALDREPPRAAQYEHEVKTGNGFMGGMFKRHAGHISRSFASGKGALVMPAAGKVIRHYNDGGEETAYSKGITISTPEDAGVIAPFDGEVVYAGPFRDYGRIVIIRHGNDYHTLLSGMEHINCTPGQMVMEGEPIGSMGEDHGTRRLYMELRKNGKPIDPSPWLKPVS